MLGVERYKVSLSPHDEDWVREFQITKDELAAIHGDNIIATHHVGSTAIKGIVAKPILDVAMVVKSVGALNITGMEAAGYEYRGEQGVPGRHLFVKRRDGLFSTHHIHCYPENHDNFISVLLFCKYLNEYPEYAKQYSDLKVELAAKYADDRETYSDGKQAFIKKIINLAHHHFFGGTTP